MQRRRFIQRLASISAWAALAGKLPAETGGDRLFTSSFSDDWTRITQGRPIDESQDITLTLPAIAENGAVVPIAINSQRDDLQQIWVLVEKNPTPLVASFQLSPYIDVAIHARIKMAESSHVHILARQDDRWLHCRQWVQVMVGGCGTG